MPADLKPSAQKVQDALTARGFPNQVIELPDSTRTAAEAAAAIGCTVGQIAKSLIFIGKASGRAVLVIASGANRVNEKALQNLLGEKIAKADADAVRAQTGYVIGGVPPLGHANALDDLYRRRLAGLRPDLGRGRSSQRRLCPHARGIGGDDGGAGCGGDIVVT